MKKILTLLALSGISSLFAQITITSNLPSAYTAGSSYDADVKINKGAVGNFAKYQMDVPMGFVINSVENKGGNFTFENNRAKIVWVSVPGDAEFTVKFKVQVGSDATAGTITQKFFYLENSEKKEVEAMPINATLGGNNAVVEAVAVMPPALVVTTPPADAPTPVTEVAKTEAPIAEVVKPTETVVAEVVPAKVAEVASTPVKEVPVKEVVNTVAKTIAPVTKTNTTTETAGLIYKIQLGAFTTEPTKGKFTNAGKVTVDLINGLYKVTTVKTCNTKDDAIKLRDELQAKGYTGLFLVKLQNGQRTN